MKQKMVLSLLVPVLMTALAAGCASSNTEGNALSGTPTHTAVFAPPFATSEEDIDGVIRQLVFDYINIKDIPIDKKTHYTDSSGTDWVRFDVHVPEDAIRAGVPPGAWEYGFLKKAPGENWELVNLGAGNIQCGAPPDVQTGLGFGICPASEEELNKAIEAFLLNGPARSRKATDVKIDSKAYYTDSSGTEWARFSILPIPHLTGATYGIMKRVPGGNWEGVNFGSAAVECGLREDVQTGLGFRYCAHG